MEIVTQVFDTALNMVVQTWNTALNSWGVFGGWLIFMAIMRKVATTFNKLKS